MKLPINTNSKYYEINLKTLIDTVGEDRAKEILSSFSCPKNKDVEEYPAHSRDYYYKDGHET